MKLHWPEYFCEALLLAAFMFAACLATVLLEHPAAMAAVYVPDAGVRRAVAGVAMGLTATGLILSPLGQRSGAHYNPAVTLTYWALGRIATLDACFYVAFQFAGGLAGTAVAWLLLGDLLEHSSVIFAVTLPGVQGPAVARLAEFTISFLLMSILLRVSNSPRWERYTPYVAGVLVALFIAFEAPYSGMSMNPARTLASALPAGQPAWLSIYFVAPPLGMLAAAVLFSLERGAVQVRCAKLNHRGPHACIFHCNHGALYER